VGRERQIKIFEKKDEDSLIFIFFILSEFGLEETHLKRSSYADGLCGCEVFASMYECVVFGSQ
jgi:hypothetical protein